MTNQTEPKVGAMESHALPDADFHRELVASIPHLRAFARSLCGHRDIADDLAQETLLKAWAARDRFRAGTSFRAWTFTILRHHYFGQLRRERFTGAYDEATAERILHCKGDQEARLEAIDVLRAMECLTATQREVLILMAIGTMSYEEIALVCGVAVGTIKSRIARARAALSAILEGGIVPEARKNFVLEGEVFDAFLARLHAIAPAYATRAA